MSIEIRISADSSPAEATIKQLGDNLAKAFAQITKAANDLGVKSGQATGAIASGLQGATSPINAFQRVVVQQLDTIIQATKSTGRATQVMAQDMQTSFRTVQAAVMPATKAATDGLQDVVGALASVYAAFKASGAIGGFISNVTLTSARTEVLNTILGQVSRTAGISGAQARVYAESVKALGITTQESNTVITRFIQNNLDLSKATQLARVSQDAAAIAGQNSSEALAGLLHAILTLQPEVARTYGLTLNLEQAYKDFAKTTGVSTESLSQNQKQQIALNSILAQSRTIAGVYEAAMDDVGKQITSLPRLYEEAANAAGATFLPSLSSGVSVLNQLLATFTALPPAVQVAIGALAAATATMLITTAAVTAGTIAWGALGTTVTALFAGPWGIAILGLGAATAGFVALTSAIARSTDAAKQQFKDMTPTQQLFSRLNGSTEDLTQSIQRLSAQTSRTTVEDIALAAQIRELETRFPELKTKIDPANQSLAEQARIAGEVATAHGALATKVKETSNVLQEVARQQRLDPRVQANIAAMQQAAPQRFTSPADVAAITEPFENVGVDQAAITLDQLKTFIAGFNQAESSFDPTKLRGKVDQLRTAYQALTEPIPGLSRAQALREFGFVDAQGKLLDDAEQRAKATAENIQREIRKQENAALGIRAETVQAQNQLAENAATFRVQKAELALQGELQRIDAGEAAQLARLERERNTLVQAASGNAAAITTIDEQMSNDRLAIAVSAEEQRVQIQQASLPKILAAQQAALTAEANGIRDMVAKGLTEREAGNAQLAAIQQKRMLLEQETNQKILALGEDLQQKQVALESGRTEATSREQAKRLEIERQGNQELLNSQLATINAQKALLQEQTQSQITLANDGVIAQTQAKEAALPQLRALQGQEFAIRETLIREQAQREAQAAIETIQNGETLALKLNAIDAARSEDLSRIGIEQQVEQQRLLNAQLEDYQHFAERVQDGLSDMIVDVVDLFRSGFENIGQFLDNLLNTMIRQIANFAAALLTQQIVMPIVAQVIGGGLLGGMGGASGVAGGAGGILQVAGLANQASSLLGIQNQIGALWAGFDALINTMNAGVMSLFHGTSTAVELAVAESAAMDAALMGTTAPAGFSTLTAVGGLAAVGGGIYGALSADSPAAQAAFAASSAAGAAAFAGTMMAAAGSTAAATGWTGYGLIAAAVLAVIGTILDQVIKPKGPRLAVGNLGGLGVGTTEGGQLTLTGGVSSQVLRREIVAREAAQEVAEALEDSVQAAAQGMIDAINSIAVDPSALATSTQEALDRAFAALPTLNSSSAKKMEEDIKAQMAYIPARLAAELLGPLADAFSQVTNLELDKQLILLPQAAAGMAQMLQGMETILAELEKVENADVRGRTHEIASRIAEFRKRLIDETVEAVSRAFEGGVDQFQQALQLTLAIPENVVALHAPLGQVQALAGAFTPIVNQLAQDILALEGALTPIDQIFTDITDRIVELQGEITEAGDNIALALPLYAQMREAILAEANLRIQQVQAIGGTLQSIEQSLFGQLSPAEQQQQLLADIAAKEQELAGQTGLDATETAAELAALNQQLLAMGESTDNLLLTQTAIENLEALQPLLEQQLIALGGTTDVQEAIKNIQQQSLDTLKSMEEDLYNLFLSNTQVQHALNLPVPVTVVNAAQQGGMIHAQMGRHIMAEPGEMVFPGPLMPTTRSALETINRSFPRFQVGGYGDGDSVPLTVPGGSFVLNRNASRAIRQGFQGGGPVQGGAPVVHNHYNVTINGTVRNDQDLRDLKSEVRKQFNELRRFDQRVIRGQR